MVRDAPLPTVDEIISTLKRSNIPTILIEGTDDLFIYRWIKRKITATPVALQACGGRNNLFSVYHRRSEFINSTVAYVADRDGFRFKPIPKEFAGIIFTKGYCIENDVYTGSEISNFIDPENKTELDTLREVIGSWFAYEVEKFLNCPECTNLENAGAHINLVTPNGNEICPKFSKSIGYIPANEKYRELVFSNYDFNVRGKQLFQMLARLLSRKGRFSKFTDKNLVEIALKTGENEALTPIIEKLENNLCLEKHSE